MTSRVGSLLVAGFLGAIALVAVVVIIILTDPGEPADSAVIVASLRDDQVVLLGDPTEIRVTVTDDEPITRIALFVDGEPISADAQPVHDPAQGSYSASIPWLPGRLGFVTISVTAQGLSGEESLIELRVEVTDDASRLGGDLTVSATRTSAGAPIVNEPLRLQARARSQEALVVRFRLEVEGALVAESGAAESEPGVYDGILEWTPTQAGTVAAEVVAETADGTQVRTELLLDVLAAVPADAAADTTAGQAGASEQEEAAQAAPADEGFLRIQTPADGAGFGWTDDLEVEVVVFADGVGTLVGMTLFVDTVPVSNVDGLQALGDGAYSLTIPWEPSGEGTFILEVVAISNTNRRYDDRVTVTVDPAEDDEEDGEGDEEDDGEDEAGDEEGEDGDDEPLADLTPTAIDVGTGQSVVVTITNAGAGNLANAPILVSLTRSSDGLVLDEATVVLTLPADRSQVVELPISLTDALEITVVVDRDNTIPESDESNNTISATFDPPSRPDLVLQALQLQPDRTVFVRVTNVGGSPAEPPIVVLIVLDGLIVEELSYGGPGPLTPQGTLDLPGSVIIGDGQSLSAIVDPANGIAESNDGNNAITVSIAP